MSDPLPSPLPAESAPLASPLGHFATDHLVKIRREMNLIPGDATTLAHIVAFIRSLISRELSDPVRVEADRARVERLAAEARQKALDDLKSRQEVEKIALVPAPTPEETAAKQDQLEAKHAAEQQALAVQHALDDLAVRQTEERKQFDAHQADERAALVAPQPGPAGPVLDVPGARPSPVMPSPFAGPQFDSRR